VKKGRVSGACAGDYILEGKGQRVSIRGLMPEWKVLGQEGLPFFEMEKRSSRIEKNVNLSIRLGGLKRLKEKKADSVQRERGTFLVERLNLCCY